MLDPRVKHDLDRSIDENDAELATMQWRVFTSSMPKSRPGRDFKYQRLNTESMGVDDLLKIYGDLE